MAIEHIAFTMYPVTDVARSRAFYGDVLGLPNGSVANDAWTEYEVGGGTFGIGTFEQVGKAGTAQSFALEVSDLDAFLERLKTHGIETVPPFDLAACRIASVRDPDGNTVWLHETKR